MVCLGNICRSPLAEGILKSKVDPELVFVDSAGTGGYHIGEKPDTRSIVVAKKYGIDIHGQRCRKFSKQDFKDFNVIYAMDSDIFNALIGLAENAEQILKVRLLLNEVDIKVKEVPDPYYGGAAQFEEVFCLIDAACTAIASRLKLS